jgi:multiphosphoryl transfer protein
MPPTSARHSTRTVVLRAPLSGVLVPIDEVPDPVFAQRLVGDGVAIDPISQTLCAPCEGVVVQVHAAGHALTIATPDGLEVMMHIGLDSVKLQGRGFEPRVAAGDHVETGQPLIDFDSDFVVRHARSLLTQLVITNGERVARLEARRGTVVASVDVALEVTLRDEDIPEAAPVEVANLSTALVGSAFGLHARPAALVVAAARASASEVRVRHGQHVASATSLVALLGLDVGPGATVRIEARGPDASAVVGRVAAALARTFEGDASEGLGAPAAPSSAPDRPGAVSGSTRVLTGLPASPGLVLGTIVRAGPDEFHVREAGGDPREERSRFDRARARSEAELEALVARLRSESAPGRSSLFEAHRALLDDPELLGPTFEGIEAGRSAAAAWRDAFAGQAARLATLQHRHLAARAADVDDVGHRVLRHLVDQPFEAPDLPHGAILVAEQLAPSAVAMLDRARVSGFCTVAGGVLSHVALLARSLGLPAVTGIDPAALDVATGTPAALDGTRGRLVLQPDPDEVRRVGERQAAEAARREGDLLEAMAPAVTTDGRRVEVLASVASVADAAAAPRSGAEGVGLLRSEFLFVDRAAPPSEEEQRLVYAELLSTSGAGRQVVIRALDAGGDKPLAYVPMPNEPNPALGERGCRALLGRPGLLRAQVRAVLRAAAHGPARLLFPMVATLVEWRALRACVEEERASLGADPLPIGLLVEVPAAALLAPHFARDVDFFSIGTNDLAQYTLAMDRAHPKLASQVDALHPAVLQLVARTVTAARAHARPVGVCGAIAGDPQAVPILVGLGVDELIVPVPVIAEVKARIRRLSWAACQVLAARALAAETADEVRALDAGGAR